MQEREELFRPEVRQHHTDSRFGTPIYEAHGAMHWYVLLAVVLVAAAFILLVITPYKETEPARGILVTSEGSHKVVAPVAAVVERITVNVGDEVREGQVLATLEKFTFDLLGRKVEQQQLEQLLAQLDLLRQQRTLQSELYQHRRQQLVAAIDELQISRELLADEAKLFQQQVRLQSSNLDALRVLRKSDAVSRSQLELAEVEHLNFELRVQETAQRRQALVVQQNSQQAELDNLALHDGQTRLQSEQESRQLQLAIDQLLNQTHLAIVAEADGVISALAVKSGQPVQVSQPLFYIDTQPEQIEATVFITSRAIGQIYPGQELLLNYDAFNFQLYGRYRATVIRIDRASLDPREHLLPVPGIQEPVFTVKASLEQSFVEGPDIHRLQSGMLFSADIVTAEMSLLAFIFKPVLELRARLA